jgi:hypothetical protein
MKKNNTNDVYRTIIKKSKDNKKRLLVFTAFLLVMTILAGCSQLTGDDSKQTVAKPAAEPEEGMYSSAPYITLDCDTIGADIYYTTDGSVPSAVNGIKYTAPFTLDPFPGTLKAIAVKDGMNTSEILTTVYTELADELIGQILLLDEKINFGTEGHPPARLFRDETRPADDLNQIKWVTGHEGQGIDLDDGYFRTHIRFVGPAFGRDYYNNFQDYEELTLSTWVYWRGAGLLDDNTTYAADENGQCLLGMSGSTGFLKVSINDSAAGGLVFAAGLYDADISCESDPAVPVPKNQWIMVTVTLDGTTMKLYFNGQKLGETANTAAIKDFGCDLFRLGSNFWGPPTCNAIFDQTSIWSRALSETVIAALYNNTN